MFFQIVPQINNFLLLLRLGFLQKIFDIFHHSLQQLGFRKHIPNPSTHDIGKIRRLLCCQFKGKRNRDLCFIQVCNVIGKGKFMPDMDKSQTWCTAQCSDYRRSKPIKADVSGRKSLIHRIACRKVFCIILSPVPRNVPFFCLLPIDFSHSCAFTSPQLLQCHT